MVRVVERAAPADVSHLVRRLGSRVLLNADEIDFVEKLQSNRLLLTRGEELVRDGDEMRSTFVIHSGWAVRYRITTAGRRQILGLSLPGDVIGLHVNFHREAIATVAALTDLEVAVIEPLRVLELYRQYPVLAAGLEWQSVYNFNILSEHNISLGARSARERILHFMLELWCRLAQIGEAEESGFKLLLTQEQIGDAMGLSQVHTNKSIRRLAAEGLIRVSGRQLEFPDPERAFAEADFDPRFLRHFSARGQRADDPRHFLGAPPKKRSTKP